LKLKFHSVVDVVLSKGVSSFVFLKENPAWEECPGKGKGEGREMTEL
jgi:hypothetical protein